MKALTILIIVSIVAVVSVAYSLFALQFEYDNNLHSQDIVLNRNYASAYDYYVQGNPIIDQKRFLGNSTAPVSLIVVIDFLSPVSRDFYSGMMQDILSQYVDTGQVTLYHKYYLTREEWEGKKGRFKYVAAVICNRKEGLSAAVELHKSLLEKGIDAVAKADPSVLQSLESDECLNATSESSYADMIETDTYRIQSLSLIVGIKGTTNTLLIGEPSPERLRRAIRNKQISVGI